MKNLIIIGAGGFSREVYDNMPDFKGYGTEFVVKGFLDRDSAILDGYENYPPILGSVESYSIQENDVFICALGDVEYKKKYTELMKSKGAVFINLANKDIHIGNNTTYGNGCIFMPFSYLSCDVKVGDFVTLMHQATIGHDARIGNYCHLGPFSFMGGFSKLCDEVIIHTGSKIMPSKTVKKGAVVGVESIVIKGVAENTTVFGIPAKKI